MEAYHDDLKYRTDVSLLRFYSQKLDFGVCTARSIARSSELKAAINNPIDCQHQLLALVFYH